MRWDDLRAFLVASDVGTLSKAARVLGVSVATLTRRIDRLEQDLGLPLARRGPTGLVPTAEGERVRALAAAGGDALAEVERLAASLQRGETREPIRISSTEPVIADILGPHVGAFASRHPEWRLDLVVSTANSNLHRNEAELAIRLARPDVSSLVARKVGSIELAPFVHRRCLAGRDPDTVELGALTWLGYDATYGAIPETDWLTRAGLIDRVAVYSSSTRALLQGVLCGTGAALLPVFQAEAWSDCVRLPGPPIRPRPLWLVFHRDMRRRPAVLAARDWIVAACREVLG